MNNCDQGFPILKPCSYEGSHNKKFPLLCFSVENHDTVTSKTYLEKSHKGKEKEREVLVKMQHNWSFLEDSDANLIASEHNDV